MHPPLFFQRHTRAKPTLGVVECFGNAATELGCKNTVVALPAAPVVAAVALRAALGHAPRAAKAEIFRTELDTHTFLWATVGLAIAYRAVAVGKGTVAQAVAIGGAIHRVRT